MMATVSFAKRESRLNPGIQAPRKTTRFLEILKRPLLGIESAPKGGYSDAGASERNQTNTKEQKAS